MSKFDPIDSKIPSDEFAYGLITLLVERGTTNMMVTDCAG